MANEITRVGVVGAGQMGSGIIEVCAKAGSDVLVWEAKQEFLAGIFLFVVLKGVARWQPLSNTVLTLIEYYIQWSLIYATIYQIIFDNLLKTLQIVKNVSALTTISSNVVLVAVLSSFIASWLGIILYKFTKEKI